MAAKHSGALPRADRRPLAGRLATAAMQVSIMPALCPLSRPGVCALSLHRVGRQGCAARDRVHPRAGPDSGGVMAPRLRAANMAARWRFARVAVRASLDASVGHRPPASIRAACAKRRAVPALALRPRGGPGKLDASVGRAPPAGFYPYNMREAAGSARPTKALPLHPAALDHGAEGVTDAQDRAARRLPAPQPSTMRSRCEAPSSTSATGWSAASGCPSSSTLSTPRHTRCGFCTSIA